MRKFRSFQVARRLGLALVLLAMVAAGLLAAPPARAATTITVCPSGCDFDNVPAAVGAAADGDTIAIAAGTYPLADELPLDKDITLHGAGTDLTVLQKSDDRGGRVFNIAAGAEVLIEDMTLTGGWMDGKLAAIDAACGGEGTSAMFDMEVGVSDEPTFFPAEAILTPAPGLCSANPSGTFGTAAAILDGNGSSFINPNHSTGPQGPAEASVNTATLLRGGGIFNAGTLILRQVRVSGNSLSGQAQGTTEAYDDAESATATLTQSLRLLGGGIYNAPTGDLTIERSTIRDNTATLTSTATATATLDAGSAASVTLDAYHVLAGGVYNDGTLTIIDSTVSDNTATATLAATATATGPALTTTTAVTNVLVGAGGVLNRGRMTGVNSTISGNSVAATASGAQLALFAAGGVFDGRQPAELSFTTVANNVLAVTSAEGQAGEFAGGVVTALPPDLPPLPMPAPLSPSAPPRPPVVNLRLFGSIVTGNTGGDCDYGDGVAGVDDGYNLSGDGSCALPQGDADLGPLADNGGPTLTHLPGPASEALGRVPADVCAARVSADQRGEPRPLGLACEAGAVEVADGAVFVSATAAGTTDDNVAFSPEDILKWDANGWSLWFDGSAAFLAAGGKSKHNINAFWIPDTGGDEVLVSFIQNAIAVPGIPGKVDGMDLVWWDGLTWSLVFDGQDVGLANLTKEKIDALHVLDDSAAPPALLAAAGGSCLRYLLISTQGDGQVTGYDGAVIKFDGTDVLGFCQTAEGATTAGKWIRVLNGKAEGLPGQALVNLSASDDGQVLYLTTKMAINVDSAVGGHSMVYAYDFGTGQFSGPYWSAPAEGLSRPVDGLQVDGTFPSP